MFPSDNMCEIYIDFITLKQIKKLCNTTYLMFQEYKHTMVALVVVKAYLLHDTLPNIACKNLKALE